VSVSTATSEARITPPKIWIEGLRRILLRACALLALGHSAQAQTWPQRPVKVLVPFAAGGNIDVMGRLASARLSEAFGQQLVAENRVGGNGVIATEAVARARPMAIRCCGPAPQ
jgi:tripartite-type tricarboxylate transporter receptor subunit TctC